MLLFSKPISTALLVVSATTSVGPGTATVQQSAVLDSATGRGSSNVEANAATLNFSDKVVSDQTKKEFSTKIAATTSGSSGVSALHAAETNNKKMHMSFAHGFFLAARLIFIGWVVVMCVKLLATVRGENRQRYHPHGAAGDTVLAVDDNDGGENSGGDGCDAFQGGTASRRAFDSLRYTLRDVFALSGSVRHKRNYYENSQSLVVATMSLSEDVDGCGDDERSGADGSRGPIDQGDQGAALANSQGASSSGSFFGLSFNRSSSSSSDNQQQGTDNPNNESQKKADHDDNPDTDDDLEQHNEAASLVVELADQIDNGGCGNDSKKRKSPAKSQLKKSNNDDTSSSSHYFVRCDNDAANTCLQIHYNPNYYFDKNIESNGGDNAKSDQAASRDGVCNDEQEDDEHCSEGSRLVVPSNDTDDEGNTDATQQQQQQRHRHNGMMTGAERDMYTMMMADGGDVDVEDDGKYVGMGHVAVKIEEPAQMLPAAETTVPSLFQRSGSNAYDKLQTETGISCVSEGDDGPTEMDTNTTEVDDDVVVGDVDEEGDGSNADADTTQLLGDQRSENKNIEEKIENNEDSDGNEDSDEIPASVSV